jgi:hypothetical protein
VGKGTKMKKYFLVLVVFVATGCATYTPYGSVSGVGSQKMIAYADPTLPVNSGVVATHGINGPSGPYAAAVALGSISDGQARRDAKEALVAVAENSYGYGGYSRGAARGGLQSGAVANSYNFTIEVSVDGGGTVPIAPKSFARFNLLPGRHTMVYYVPDSNNPENVSQRQKDFVVDELRNATSKRVGDNQIIVDWYQVVP